MDEALELARLRLSLVGMSEAIGDRFKRLMSDAMVMVLTEIGTPPIDIMERPAPARERKP